MQLLPSRRSQALPSDRRPPLLCPLLTLTCLPFLCCSVPSPADVRRDRERVPGRSAQRKAPSGSSQTTTAALPHSHPSEAKDSANGHHPSAPHGVDVPRTVAQEIGGTTEAGAGGRGAEGGGAEAGGAGGAGDDSAVYGSSYTNRRSKEFDLLHDIVRQTRSAFIDIAQKPHAIHEEDAQERSTLYTRHIALQQTQTQTQGQGGGVAVTGGAAAVGGGSSLLAAHLLSAGPLVPSVFHVPSEGGVEWLTVSGGRLGAEERRWVVQVAAEMTAAIEGAALKDTGRIVLAFDDL